MWVFNTLIFLGNIQRFAGAVQVSGAVFPDQILLWTPACELYLQAILVIGFVMNSSRLEWCRVSLAKFLFSNNVCGGNFLINLEVINLVAPRVHSLTPHSLHLQAFLALFEYTGVLLIFLKMHVGMKNRANFLSQQITTESLKLSQTYSDSSSQLSEPFSSPGKSGHFHRATPAASRYMFMS